MEGAPGGASRAHRPGTGRCSDCVRRKITGVRTPSKCVLLCASCPCGYRASWAHRCLEAGALAPGDEGAVDAAPRDASRQKSLSTRTLAELGSRSKPSL